MTLSCLARGVAARLTAACVAAVLGLVGLSGAAGASGFGVAATHPNLMRVAISRGGEGPVSEQLLLGLNKAAIVELPVDAHDVLVSNPAIADAVIRTPRRAYILGVEGGQTNAFFFDADGRQILNLEIRVERDVTAVQDLIDRLLPNANIVVEALNDNLVLSGVVGSASEADQAAKIARRFVDDDEKILSMVAISGKEQVLLKVRIVEMQRTITKQLGVDLSSALRVSDELAVGIATDHEFSLIGRSLGGATAALGFNNLGGGDVRSADLTLQALERVGLVRTLAEPNLTAITGESAEFLAGGEFPVPVGRDSEGQIIIEYKPFGVGLSFTPVVLSEGRISMFVSTEVSELTNQGALDINGGAVDSDGDGIVDTAVDGLTLPGLKVRRAQTTVEMPSGGSLVMAGLIQDKTKQNIDGTPGMKDLPGIGALFRSRDYESDETELVVIVTPYLVESTSANALATPSDGYATPNELETIFFGRLNKVYRAPGASVDGGGWRGPVGLVLDDKQG